MAGGLSGDGDGDITDELIPAGKNKYLIDLCTSMQNATINGQGAVLDIYYTVCECDNNQTKFYYSIS